MEEESHVPEIPKIESENLKEELHEEAQTSSTLNITTKIKETVNLQLFLPNIHSWIRSKLKVGPTLIIGEKIGDFAIEISNQLPSVIARECSSTYISPAAEVKDASGLEKIDFKPFDLQKLPEINQPFINIIVIFALRKLERNEQKQLLDECKRMMTKNGQLIVVGEFYARSVFLFPVTAVKETIRAFKRFVLKRKMDRPITKLDKLANELELKFFDVKYDAGGRVRTYVLTKRWGALVS